MMRRGIGRKFYDAVNRLNGTARDQIVKFLSPEELQFLDLEISQCSTLQSKAAEEYRSKHNGEDSFLT